MEIFGIDLSAVSSTTWIAIVVGLLVVVGLLAYKYWFDEDDAESPSGKRKNKKCSRQEEEELDELIDEIEAKQAPAKRRR
jgi:FtsZ-interacting cell division protein ZipA